MNKNDSGR